MNSNVHFQAQLLVISRYLGSVPDPPGRLLMNVNKLRPLGHLDILWSPDTSLGQPEVEINVGLKDENKEFEANQVFE